MRTVFKKTAIALLALWITWLLPAFPLCWAQPSNLFPGDEWAQTDPEAQGVQSRLLAQMLEHIRDNRLAIDSITVVRNGVLVLDAHFWPFTREKQHNIYSCTKSVMSALIGIAIQKGYIQGVDQPLSDLFPDRQMARMDDHKRAITLKHLLTMSAGLECRDSYLYKWVGLEQMHSKADWAQHVLDLPTLAPPGQVFEYCNGVSHLLSAILQGATEMKTRDFARQHLFAPLGIRDFTWDRDPAGIDFGYANLQLGSHDLARFGWLYLNNGLWGDKQILPAAWVRASTDKHMRAELFNHYGYQWWIDNADYYMAVGYKGQRVFVVPDKKMVVVFLANLSGADGLLPKVLLDRYILPAATPEKSLPDDAQSRGRLAELVEKVSGRRTEGDVWLSVDEGVALDGVFKRRAQPAFQLTYPLGSQMQILKHDGQIMNMRTLGGIDFGAFVMDPPPGMQLKDFGPLFYAPKLNAYGSAIEVVSNTAITLKCGTPAYRTDIKWLTRSNLPIATYLVSALKGGKLVVVNAHPWKNHLYMEPIVQSLEFK